MMVRVTLDTVMKVIRITSSPIISWPLPSDASRTTILRREICRWMIVIHITFIASLMLYDIYRSCIHDIEHAVTISAEFATAILIITTIMICKKEEIRVKGLLDELQAFMKRANQEELDVIQSYIDKCLYFHTVILVSAIGAIITFILGPTMMTEQFLPLDFEYPYLVETSWVFTVMYLSQTIGIAQVGSTVIFDFVFAILLWYTGAGIEMLAKQLGRATTHKDVRRCVRQHQNLLEYVERLKIPARIIVSAAISLALVSIIAGGLVLMRSERISVAAFHCKWVGQTPEVIKDLLFIMHKAQTPVVIDLPGITPALTLEFYTSIMKAIFSYLATLHAMLGN